MMQAGSRTAVAILSMHSDEAYVIRSLNAGARAYLLKDSAEADLIEAVRAIHQGRSFFSPAISRMLQEDWVRELQNRQAEDSYELLTSRLPFRKWTRKAIPNRKAPKAI